MIARIEVDLTEPAIEPPPEETVALVYESWIVAPKLLVLPIIPPAVSAFV